MHSAGAEGVDDRSQATKPVVLVGGSDVVRGSGRVLDAWRLEDVAVRQRVQRAAYAVWGVGADRAVDAQEHGPADV
jgi:hypothetical protein